MPSAGSMDKRITILRYTATSNAFNEQVKSWAPLATVWAECRDASASEAYRAKQVQAEITTRFTVRWSSIIATVTPLDRVQYRGRTYDITAVRDVGSNAWREIDAVARAEGT